MHAFNITTTSPASLRCTIHPGNEVELDRLETLWRRIEADGTSSFFLSWTWIGCWLRLVTPHVRWWLLRLDAGSDTVGLAVFVEGTKRRLGLMRAATLHLHQTGISDYDSIFIENNGLLLARDQEPGPAWRAAIAELVQRFPGIQEYHFGGVPASVATLIPELTLGRRILHRRTSYAVDLRTLSSLDDYLARLSTNSRQQVRRAIRQFEKHGPLAVHAAQTDRQRLEFLAALEELHQRHWRTRGATGAFGAPFFRRFHREVVQSDSAGDAVQLLRVEAGNRTLGYLYNFRHSNRVSAYQSGFDYDLERSGRPGVVCHVLAVEFNRVRGAAFYDHLAGWNRMKESLAEPESDQVWMKLQRKSLRFALESAIEGATSRWNARHPEA